MAVIICPADICKRIKDAPTKAKRHAAQLAALAWIKSQLPNLGPNDGILIPNPTTGALESFEKTGEPWQQ